MVTYIEDLVQNIYTNCDMSGLDKLNEGLKDAIVYSSTLEQNLRRANQAQKEGFDFHAREIEMNKQVYLLKRQQQSLLNQENVYRANMAERQLRWDEERQYRQEKYNRSLKQQNGLMRFAGRLLVGWFSISTLKNIVDTGSRIQLVQKSIEGLTKSTQDWKFIQDQAFKTGTDIEVAAKGYRNFFSSAKMAGFEKGSIQSMYSDVLLSTRAIGASTQQTESALLALEQMLSKGRVSMEELRRQLGNAIPGAFEIGAAAMNMTTAEFNKFVQKVGIASNEFVPKFIEQLKKTYADGFASIEQTVSVAQIRLSNAWKLLTNEIMSGETGKALAKGLNELAKLLSSPEFLQFVDLLGRIFTFIVKIISFAIQHLPIILMYLGYMGITGALKAILGHLVAVQLAIFKTTGAAITLGQAGVASFMAMAGAVGTFIKSFIPLITILLVLEDLVYFIGEKLFGWKVNSLTGAILARAGEKVGKKNLNMNIVNPEGDMKAVVKHADKLAREGRFDELVQYQQGLRGGVDTYSGIRMPTQGMNFDKEENNTVNVRIENLNVGNANTSDMGSVGDAIGNSIANTIQEVNISKGGKPTSAFGIVTDTSLWGRKKERK